MMGSEVVEILQFFALSAEQKDDYSMVLNHFEHHLVKKKRMQSMKEPSSMERKWIFITALYGVASTCVSVWAIVSRARRSRRGGNVW